MPTRVAFDPKSEPSHWFVLDVAMARERAIPLLGPPPSQLLAPIPQHQIRQALEASLDWHATHQPSTPNAVLNACRAWHYTQTGHWSSKSTAATWALQHVKDPAKIRAALAVRNRTLGSTS